MRNDANKVLFRWDVAILGAMALALVLWAVPFCSAQTPMSQELGSRAVRLFVQN
jgi:hypothetical protein